MPPERPPEMGLGTMGYDIPEDCVGSVAAALEMGYRHVDTAQKYQSEREVGRAIARSSVPREDVFLATKVAETNLSYDQVIETTEESLDRLGVDRVDVLYVHWPAPTYEAESTLAAFNELVDDGATRHVGVANFTPDLIDEAREILDQPPIAVQVEMHPLLQQEELRSYARANDASLVAYCPLMRGEVFDQPELEAIADDAGVSVAELSLGWLASKDAVVPIPKATGEAHLRENLEAAGRSLDEETVARVDAIEREHRVVDPPEKGPWNW